MAVTTTTKKQGEQGKKGIWYIVNPAGAIHSADREHARLRLALPGWRLAEESEIVTYKGQAIQRFDQPICRPWTPDPENQLKLPDEE